MQIIRKYKKKFSSTYFAKVIGSYVKLHLSTSRYTYIYFYSRMLVVYMYVCVCESMQCTVDPVSRNIPLVFEML